MGVAGGAAAMLTMSVVGEGRGCKEMGGAEEAHTMNINNYNPHSTY